MTAEHRAFPGRLPPAPTSEMGRRRWRRQRHPVGEQLGVLGTGCRGRRRRRRRRLLPPVEEYGRGLPRADHHLGAWGGWRRWCGDRRGADRVVPDLLHPHGPRGGRRFRRDRRCRGCPPDGDGRLQRGHDGARQHGEQLLCVDGGNGANGPDWTNWFTPLFTSPDVGVGIGGAGGGGGYAGGGSASIGTFRFDNSSVAMLTAVSGGAGAGSTDTGESAHDQHCHVDRAAGQRWRGGGRGSRLGDAER